MVEIKVGREDLEGILEALVYAETNMSAHDDNNVGYVEDALYTVRRYLKFKYECNIDD